MGGRPSALSEDDLALARAMLANPDVTVADVAERLGVAPSTLYQHLSGGRSGLSE